DLVEQPRELGPREVGVENEPRLPGEERFVPGLSQSVTSGRGSSVLPDDGVGQRAPRGTLPEDGRFALVGDPDRRHVRGAETGGGERLGGYVALCTPDLQGIVLHPAGAGIDLAEFLLRSLPNEPFAPEDDGP